MKYFQGIGQKSSYNTSLLQADSLLAGGELED
jgi:hypothetical protein